MNRYICKNDGKTWCYAAEEVEELNIGGEDSRPLIVIGAGLFRVCGDSAEIEGAKVLEYEGTALSCGSTGLRKHGFMEIVDPFESVKQRPRNFGSRG